MDASVIEMLLFDLLLVRGLIAVLLPLLRLHRDAGGFAEAAAALH
jgi:hypothetical protein